MRVDLVDVPAVTPPYDHALAAALGRAGADVTLLTSLSPYGWEVATLGGYRTESFFYRRSSRLRGERVRRAAKVAELPLDLARYRRRASAADVVHYQWLGLEEVAARLLPGARPRVWTAHDIVPREPRRHQARAFASLMRRMDAIVVHSEHGAERLRREIGVAPERIRVIPHGAFVHLTRADHEAPLPPELAAVDAPVALFFGFLSPYKGVDVLLDAFARVGEGRELWVVGVPRLDMAELERRARRAPGTVRFVPRFVPDAQLPPYFRRADVVVLPYREIDQSGVLYTGLAFGKPMVVTRVGGLPEVADRDGAAVAVPPEDPEALGAALSELLDDPEARRRLGAAAEHAAGSTYSWDAIGRRTLDLYRELLGGSE